MSLGTDTARCYRVHRDSRRSYTHQPVAAHRGENEQPRVQRHRREGLPVQVNRLRTLDTLPHEP